MRLGTSEVSSVLMIPPQYDHVVNNILVKDFLKMGDPLDQNTSDQTRAIRIIEKIENKMDPLKSIGSNTHKVSTLKNSILDDINKETIRVDPADKTGPRAHSALDQPSFLNGWQ
jgi:hypothetical protein